MMETCLEREKHLSVKIEEYVEFQLWFLACLEREKHLSVKIEEYVELQL